MLVIVVIPSVNNINLQHIARIYFKKRCDIVADIGEPDNIYIDAITSIKHNQTFAYFNWVKEVLLLALWLKLHNGQRHCQTP